jgi:predicted regulator of Ras-like GTPase activity (Roadblock/LC7/MglB family)
MTGIENWMIDEVVGVPGVRHVVVTTSDGIVTARSGEITRDDADRLGAMCAGLYAIGQNIADAYGDGTGIIHQNMIRFGGGFLFVRRAADGSRLAVVTSPAVDPAVIGQQMGKQVQKIGDKLSAAPRHPSPAA